MVAFAEIVGNICIENDKLVVSDEFGLLVASDLRGNKLWNISSSNNPNENSYPVISDNAVYFTGAAEFFTVNLNSGDIIYAKELDDNSAHLFGQRVVPYRNNRILFPTNTSVQVISMPSGKIEKEINIPEGSRMTPAVYKDQLVIVNQSGSILLIDIASGNINAEIPSSMDMPLALSFTIKGDLAVTAGKQGTVSLVNLASKRIVWEKNLSEGSRLVFYKDILFTSRIIIAASKNKIFGLSADTGKLLFTKTFTSSPPCLVGGNLYFGTQDGFLKVTDLYGNEKASLELEENITARPLYLNERVYLGTETGTIFIINPEGLN